MKESTKKSLIKIGIYTLIAVAAVAQNWLKVSNIEDEVRKRLDEEHALAAAKTD